MKVTKYLAVFFISLLIFGSLNAQPAQFGEKGRHDGDFRGPNPERMMDRLNLTDEQKSEFEKIHTSTMKEALPIKNQIDEKEAELKTLETAENADLSKINKTIDEIGSLKTKLAKLHAAGKQKIRSLLTEEQRIKFDMQSDFRHQKRMEQEPRGKRWMN